MSWFARLVQPRSEAASSRRPELSGDGIPSGDAVKMRAKRFIAFVEDFLRPFDIQDSNFAVMVIDKSGLQPTFLISVTLLRCTPVFASSPAGNNQRLSHRSRAFTALHDAIYCACASAMSSYKPRHASPSSNNCLNLQTSTMVPVVLTCCVVAERAIIQRCTGPRRWSGQSFQLS